MSSCGSPSIISWLSVNDVTKICDDVWGRSVHSMTGSDQVVVWVSQNYVRQSITVLEAHPATLRPERVCGVVTTTILCHYICDSGTPCVTDEEHAKPV